MEQIIIGFLILNVFLLVIMLWYAKRAVRLLKRQVKRIEEMEMQQESEVLQQENNQLRKSNKNLQNNVPSQNVMQSKEATGEQEVIQTTDLEAEEKKAELINEVLSEIFS